MKTTTFTLILGVVIGVGIACGPPPPPQGPQDKRTEIIALWTQIRDWRLEAGMGLNPAPDTLIGVRKQSVAGVQRVCNVQVPTTCNDICNLADAICDNAERICEIAAELGPNDKLGVEKCDSAKGSCREAKQRCCKCSNEATKASIKW